MSWAFFIDESGQDRRASPYEVLAALAVEDRKIWPLIRQLSADSARPELKKAMLPFPVTKPPGTHMVPMTRKVKIGARP